MSRQYFHYRLRRREQLKHFDAWLLRIAGRRLWLLALGIALLLAAFILATLLLTGFAFESGIPASMRGIPLSDGMGGKVALTGSNAGTRLSASGVALLSCNATKGGA